MDTMIELRRICVGQIHVSKLVYNSLQDLICEFKKNNKKINMAKAISIKLENSCQLSKSAQDTQPVTVTTDIEITPTQIEEAMDEIFDYKSNGYLTNKEAAKFIGCNESEICNAHKHGTLKYRRTGRVIRQHVDDLKKWNEERLKKLFMQQPKEKDSNE